MRTTTTFYGGSRSSSKECVLKSAAPPGLVFGLVFIILISVWAVAVKQEKEFNEGRCAVVDGQIATQPSACTCRCPRRVRDQCDDDKKSAALNTTGAALELEQFGSCFDSCFGTCCRDANCNLRHDGSTAVWTVVVVNKTEDDTCPVDFGATIRGGKKCTETRGNGESFESLSSTSRRSAIRDLAHHVVGRTYRCFYRVDSCHGSDAQQTVKWDLLPKKGLFISWITFLVLTGVCLAIIAYVLCLVPCVDATCQCLHNLKFKKVVDPDPEVFVPRQAPPRYDGDEPPEYYAQSANSDCLPLWRRWCFWVRRDRSPSFVDDSYTAPSAPARLAEPRSAKQPSAPPKELDSYQW